MMRPGYEAWTDAQKALLRKIYSTDKKREEIANLVGHPVESVYNMARKLGLRRVGRAQTPQYSDGTKQALAFAARKQGVGSDELDMGKTKGVSFLCKLVRRGQLVARRLGLRVRYFTTDQAADAYVSANPFVFKAPLPKTGHPRQRWAPDTPAFYPVDADGLPLYRITIAPPPPQPTHTNTHAR